MNEKVKEVLKALDQAKDRLPQDWGCECHDEDIMFQVMEMEYMPKPLGEQLGVGKELFPPSTQLEDDEIKLIVEKILDVWAAYNYLADLPEGLPIRIAYDTLLGVWDEIVGCFPFGSFHFDFYDMELEQYVNRKNQESL